MQVSLHESFYLFGTFHGLFLAVMLLLSGKAHKGTVFLAWLILLFSFYLFENVLYSSGYIRNVPWMFLTTLPLTFLIGPLFYFYVRKSCDPYFQVQPRHLVHLVPALLDVILLLPFYTLDSGVKIRLYEESLNRTASWSFNPMFAAYLVYFLLAVGYCVSAYLIAARESSKGTNRRSQWLRHASVAMITYLVIAMVLSCYLLFDGSPSQKFYHINLLLQTLLIQLVGYTAFAEPLVFHSDFKPRKYRFSSLNAETMEVCRVNLIQLMEKQKPYLDPDVTPDQLAAKLGISKHNLSQLLNERLQTSFYDFLSEYRVQRARELLATEAYRNAKIFHVAYDSGFSSKSTFLRSFRKLTGLTPSEFRNQSQKEVSLH